MSLNTMPTVNEFIFGFFMSCVWGFICMQLAKKKGRNPKGWFILGIFFSVFALLFLLFVPSQKAMNKMALAKAEVNSENAQISATSTSYQSTETTLEARSWYYLDHEHNQCGPIDLQKIKEMKKQGTISSKTYLWSEGMMDWTFLSKLPYLNTELE